MWQSYCFGTIRKKWIRRKPWRQDAKSVRKVHWKTNSLQWKLFFLIFLDHCWDIFLFRDRQQLKRQKDRMRGNEEERAGHANNEKQNLPQTRSCNLHLHDLTRTQWTNPTNTSQLNQHARVQRKDCKLMGVETSEWASNALDYIDRPRVIFNECEMSFTSASPSRWVHG